MLKIKDDVNLRELEKFGFTYNGGSECYVDNRKDSFISIYTEDREIVIDINDNLPVSIYDTFAEDKEKAKNKLFDLIQAGLVEKVKEN